METPTTTKSGFELFGPYRTVITRRVTEEETISIETYSPDVDKSVADLDRYLESLRNHRKAYNEEVVLSSMSRLKDLDDDLRAKAMELNAIKEEIAIANQTKGKIARRGVGGR